MKMLWKSTENFPVIKNANIGNEYLYKFEYP